MNHSIVWLVARECLRKGQEPHREAGEKLAARAAAAGKRQKDLYYAAAVLREWGQLDLDRGDKAKAEARWAEMLEMMLPKPNPARTATGPAPVPPPPAPVPVPAPAAPAPVKSPQSRGMAALTTVL